LRLQKKLRREYEALRSIDFFPGDAAAEAEAAWTDFNTRIERLADPPLHRPRGALSVAGQAVGDDAGGPARPERQRISVGRAARTSWDSSIALCDL
jgi:hypothetical protein